MSDQSSKTEHRFLLVAAVANLLIGCVGVAFSFVASSQAILLDGVFNLTYFVTGLFTIRVAQLVRQGDDQQFHFGYAYFEPLINGIKGVLVLGVTMLAFVDAIRAILSGGREIAAGPAIGYGLFATAACGAMAYATRRGAERTGSPLIAADAQNWLVNAAISSAVLLAFACLYLIKGTAMAVAIPYVDPGLVILVVLISISVPVRMAWSALMELLNRAPRPEITRKVESTIAACTAQLPVQDLFVRVTQPGRSRMVVAHVVLPSDYQVGDLASLDALRSKTSEELQKDHADTMVELIFTTQRDFGVPTSEMARTSTEQH